MRPDVRAFAEAIGAFLERDDLRVERLDLSELSGLIERAFADLDSTRIDLSDEDGWPVQGDEIGTEMLRAGMRADAVRLAARALQLAVRCGAITTTAAPS